ncbi:MAG TPA: NYN domain-containing protein [Gemmatimonadales bacterium]
MPAHHLPAAPVIHHHAPNAALLIDFDNVTLGVRSDLAKELRTLLNSDIIKGKVAVQRAYADWRRYPQYIVSLSEASIDLIFAPAFGTAKKNATDIRLAVDAIELVFTRPEIGTYILLSGDSDFSSMVLKLKEYGKYVIGVGIRESASDILIQNCDEYYSYSDLAGLSKEAEGSAVPHDPWELVTVAIEQMVRNHDVMRADRLKQVMQHIDPEFDEARAGFNRFSKFVTEAGNRGLITVIKLENGQLDVALPPAGKPAAKPATAVAAAPARDGEAPASRRRRGGRGRGRSASAAAPADEESAAPAAPRAPARPSHMPSGLTLAEAFHLMARALGELPAPVPQEALRARMAALHAKEDVLLEPVRFLKLLRQANDAEIADVRMVSDSEYEISPHKANLAMQVRPLIDATAAPTDGAPPPAPRAPAALRFRGGSRSASRSPLQMVGVIDLNATSTNDAPPATVAAALPPTAPALVAPAPANKAPSRGGARAKKPAGKVTVAAPPAPARTAKTVKAAKTAPKTPKSAKKAASARPSSKPRSR